jgi:hypothetical protein
MLPNASLAAGHHTPAQRAAAGDACLSSNHRVLPDPDVVGNLNEVIDFNAASNASVVE